MEDRRIVQGARGDQDVGIVVLFSYERSPATRTKPPVKRLPALPARFRVSLHVPVKETLPAGNVMGEVLELLENRVGCTVA